MRFLAKKCENIAKSRQKMIPEDLIDYVYAIVFVCLFVCVEVLRPSQPNGVMSSAVSFPNHTFTGQA